MFRLRSENIPHSDDGKRVAFSSSLLWLLASGSQAHDKDRKQRMDGLEPRHEEILPSWRPCGFWGRVTASFYLRVSRELLYLLDRFGSFFEVGKGAPNVIRRYFKSVRGRWLGKFTQAKSLLHWPWLQTALDSHQGPLTLQLLWDPRSE